MIRIGLNELRNLVININIATGSSTEENNMSAERTILERGTSLTESFVINPYAGNINLSSNEKSKLYLKVIEKIPAKDKLHISILTGLKVREMLMKYQSKYDWRLVLRNVRDSTSDP